MTQAPARQAATSGQKPCNSLEDTGETTKHGRTVSLSEALALVQASDHPQVDNLADWLLVSALQSGGEAPTQVLAEASEAGLTVRIAKAEGQKCERCWHFETDIGRYLAHPSLCGRCVAVLEPQPRA